jgi:hypothetical protein
LVSLSRVSIEATNRFAAERGSSFMTAYERRFFDAKRQKRYGQSRALIVSPCVR